MIGASTTLLFTDIEGSTQALHRLGERYSDLLGEHHRLMREAIESAGGREVDTAGDSFFAVFARAGSAVDCAQRAQMNLAGGEWPGGEAPRVRMGIHAGNPELSDGEFVGMDVHRAARVMAVAFGGQVLLTEETVRLLGSTAQVRDLGVHRLKDLPAPEHLFQLVVPGLDREFPALRSLNRSNLPIPPNPLVGRQEEIARALELLSRPDVRLLTLLGAGGAGKTRLAIELAAEASTRYRDGVWIAPLAAVPDRALMVAEIARMLEIDQVASEPLGRTLLEAVAERELLLVLDNFEHLIDAADLVADLLAAAAKIDLLVTSREPLKISGEHRMQVPPLPRHDASELFVQRALAVRPELTVDEEERAAVDRISKRLDGLPLALELAAARVAVFGPTALEARLADGLALPEGPRDLPERQRTLRATIDWSYQLLASEEQAMFRALAPFVGGVRVESAESIWDVDAVESLFSLAEKSLLSRREDFDREPRFWMLETVREFASERAAADASAVETAARHAQFFLALSEQAAPHILGPAQRQWLDRLDHDQANLRAALDHLTERAPDQAVRMAGNLTWFWEIRGYFAEARRWLNRTLAYARTDAPASATALFGAGRMAVIAGDAAAARPLLLRALPLARDQTDRSLEVMVLSHLGWVADATGDRDHSIALHEEAIATARAAGDDWALGLALNNYAVIPGTQTDLEQARVLLEEALLLRRGIGEPRAIALTANNLAEIALAADKPEEADTLIDEALRHAREIDYRPMIATALGTRAEIALTRGDADSARARLREAIESSGAGYDIEFTAALLSTAGTLAAMTAEPTKAATLWGAADAARSRVHSEDYPTTARLRARWEPEARAAIPTPPGWGSARAAGTRMALNEALAIARSAAGVLEP